MECRMGKGFSGIKNCVYLFKCNALTHQSEIGSHDDVGTAYAQRLCFFPCSDYEQPGFENRGYLFLK